MRILSGSYNGDGTYNVIFSAPVTLVAPDNELNWIMQDPSQGWSSIQTISQVNPTTIQIQPDSGSTTVGIQGLVGAPTTLTAALPFLTLAFTGVS